MRRQFRVDLTLDIPEFGSGAVTDEDAGAALRAALGSEVRLCYDIPGTDRFRTAAGAVVDVRVRPADNASRTARRLAGPEPGGAPGPRPDGGILGDDEASKYGDPALGGDRPVIWIRGVPHVVRGVRRRVTPKVGDVLELAVLGRPGSRVLISRPDSVSVSRRLRAGERRIDLGDMQDAQLIMPRKPVRGA